MKASTDKSQLLKTRSPLAVDIQYHDDTWDPHINSISNNFIELLSRNIKTVRLQWSRPLPRPNKISFAHNLSDQILCLSKCKRLLQDNKILYPLWSIRIHHKNSRFFYSSQTPYILNYGLGSFFKNILSYFLKILQVSNGDLLFRKVPKNPT